MSGAELSHERATDETRAVQRAVDDDGSRGVLRARALPRVLHDSPAAVLLLDLVHDCVVQANPAGRELAPALGLPAPVAEWVAAARAVRADRSAYADGDDPLSRIVAGQAVDGEPLLVGPQGSPVWLTGLVLTDRQGPPQALVVLFPLDPGEDAEIRDRAVVAAGLSFTISDPRLPDNPLVFVNPAFERTTGYLGADVVGRNCRFLQGPDTDPAAVQRVRDAMAGEQFATITLLNYRKDGSAFWNELSLSPVYDAEGSLTHLVGIQADVTARVAVEQERERHLVAERTARAAAERAQLRLALLAEAT